MQNTTKEKLESAMSYAMANRPKVGGFPFLAECLRQAGVKYNTWSLPAVQSIYNFGDEAVVSQGNPLVTGIYEVPKFDQDILIKALRLDQAGESDFPAFLMSAWLAGVVTYEVDFETRKVTYFGACGEIYEENYTL